VNQTDEVEIIRHGRELAANRMGHQKESAIEHEHDNAAEASRAFKGFQRTVTTPLNLCLSPGVHFTARYVSRCTGPRDFVGFDVGSLFF